MWHARVLPVILGNYIIFLRQISRSFSRGTFEGTSVLKKSILLIKEISSSVLYALATCIQSQYLAMPKSLISASIRCTCPA